MVGYGDTLPGAPAIASPNPPYEPPQSSDVPLARIGAAHLVISLRMNPAK